MKLLADRLRLIRPLLSLLAPGRARALAVSGADACNSTAGEPEFETPRHSVDAAHAAALPGETGYTVAVAALQESMDFFGAWKRLYQRSRDLIVFLLDGRHGLKCPSPPGAFFVYVGCEALMGSRTPQGRRVGLAQARTFAELPWR